MKGRKQNLKTGRHLKRNSEGFVFYFSKGPTEASVTEPRISD